MKPRARTKRPGSVKVMVMPNRAILRGVRASLYSGKNSPYFKELLALINHLRTSRNEPKKTPDILAINLKSISLENLSAVLGMKEGPAKELAEAILSLVERIGRRQALRKQPPLAENRVQ